MLVASVAVEHLGDTHLEVARTLGGRTDARLAGRHDHELPRPAISGEILLDRLRLEELGVTPHHFARALKRLDLLAAEDALPGSEQARSEEIARAQSVSIGDHGARIGLRVAHRRHA